MATFSVFLLIWLGIAAVAFGGLVVGVVALIDVARTPMERFGPWWDNTRQAWILGLAVSFLVPAGSLIAGILWFTGGRRGPRPTRGAGRPFWTGPPKPPPPWGPTPPGWAPPTWAPPASPPAGWGQQPPTP